LVFVEKENPPSSLVILLRNNTHVTYQKRKKNFKELNCIALIIAFLPKICELFTTAFQGSTDG
jgi:hypothetical protein